MTEDYTALERWYLPFDYGGAEMTRNPVGDYVRYSDHADAIASLERQLAEVRGERDEARAIVRDIHWMAVRYADNRKSYAVGMCNDAIRKAYDSGWLVYSESRQNDLDPQYARDGMFDKEWRSAVDNANDRATTAEAEIDRLAARCGDAETLLRAFLTAEYESKSYLFDCVDNHGKPYQSQWLADRIAETERFLATGTRAALQEPQK